MIGEEIKTKWRRKENIRYDFVCFLKNKKYADKSSIKSIDNLQQTLCFKLKFCNLDNDLLKQTIKTRQRRKILLSSDKSDIVLIQLMQQSD